jgi:hypothetical protein
MPVKQNIKGFVMGRLLGTDERVQVIPGIETWTRTSKHPCVHCRADILKGDQEIRVAVCAWGRKPVRSHYHKDCFKEHFARRMEELGL